MNRELEFTVTRIIFNEPVNFPYGSEEWLSETEDPFFCDMGVMLRLGDYAEVIPYEKVKQYVVALESVKHGSS